MVTWKGVLLLKKSAETKTTIQSLLPKIKKTFTLANSLLGFLRRNEFSAILTLKSNENPQAAMTEPN